MITAKEFWMSRCRVGLCVLGSNLETHVGNLDSKIGLAEHQAVDIYLGDTPTQERPNLAVLAI